MINKRQTSDEATRREFKAQQAQRIAALKNTAPAPLPTKETIPVTLPLNYHSLDDVELFGILKTTQNLTAEQAADVLNHIRGRLSTDAYAITLSGKPYVPTVSTPAHQEPVGVVEPRKRSIELPWNFERLSDSQKFQWLLAEARLDKDEANDVIDMLVGRPTYSGTVFELSIAAPPQQLQRPVKIEVEPASKPAPKPEPVRDPSRFEFTIPGNVEFGMLSAGEQYWFLVSDLGLSYDEANEVVAIYHGLLESNDHISRDGNKFTITRKETAEVVLQPEQDPFKSFTLVLPHEFRLLTAQQQFSYLQVEQKLAPELAADVLALLDGRRQTTGFEFEISFADPATPGQNPIPDYVTRKITNQEAIKNAQTMQVREPKAKPTFTAPTSAPLPTVEITLPHEFQALSLGLQHQYLQTEKKLLPAQASDVLASIKGSPVVATNFVVAFDAPAVSSDNPVENYIKAKTEAAAAREARKQVRQPKAKPAYSPPAQGIVRSTLAVTLPNWFNGANPPDQFTYLTRTKQMLPEDASDLIAHLSGFKTNKVFEVEYEEG